jgi:hypothetical protein
MELQYTVRGADGREYGPTTLDQLSNWIKEGRLPARQQVKRSDMEYWALAGDFLELQPLYASMGIPASANTAAPAPAAKENLVAASQVRSGASWFYWIAALSLINSIAAFSGSSWRFIIGLGITQLLDEIGASIPSGGKAVVLVLDVLAAGMFVGFGWFAQKGHLWAFLVGMIVFALDGLVFLLAQDWLGVGFHVFILYFLFRGFNACRSSR